MKTYFLAAAFLSVFSGALVARDQPILEDPLPPPEVGVVTDVLALTSAAKLVAGLTYQDGQWVPAQ